VAYAPVPYGCDLSADGGGFVVGQFQHSHTCTATQQTADTIEVSLDFSAGRDDVLGLHS
jgi:hypothetical protein